MLRGNEVRCSVCGFVWVDYFSVVYPSQDEAFMLDTHTRRSCPRGCWGMVSQSASYDVDPEFLVVFDEEVWNEFPDFGDCSAILKRRLR
jgi:hypothetical protein